MDLNSIDLLAKKVNQIQIEPTTLCLMFIMISAIDFPYMNPLPIEYSMLEYSALVQPFWVQISELKYSYFDFNLEEGRNIKI